jgi:hypothetical protein
VLVEHAENDYLELLAEGGVTGLGLGFGAAVAFGLRWQCRSDRARDPLRRGLSLGSAAGLAALGIHSLLDFNLHIPSNALLFSALAAISLAAASPSPPTRLGGTRSLALLSVLAVLLMSGPPPPNRLDTLGSIQVLQVRKATPLRLRETENEVVRYLNGRPADAEAWVWLGWSRTRLGRRGDGRALASYGSQLDPLRTGLGEGAKRLWN